MVCSNALTCRVSHAGNRLRLSAGKALSRWGHLILPEGLIAIRLVILITGGAFGM